MSKLTLDDAIKHCLEVAEQNEQGLYDAIALGGQSPTQEEIANCEQCAADHRQLAEWLRELKDLREENKVLTRDDLRLIKSNDKLRKKVGVIAKYKRLLKLAVEDIESTDNCCLCKYHHNPDYICQTVEDCFTWRYADEVLKLIES